MVQSYIDITVVIMGDCCDTDWLKIRSLSSVKLCKARNNARSDYVSSLIL